MAERLCSGLYDFHIYYPWDKTKFVRRALDSLRPAAFVAAETELWPNMLGECRERGVPAFLVNGRISDRTWRRISGALSKRIAARAYSLFDEILLRDEEDARRLSSIGVDAAKLHVTGDGKVDALLARKDFSARDEWLEKFGAERPIFMAGSTHAGEDEKALAAFESLRGALPDARLIIAPRHPERSDAVCRLIPPKYVFAKLSQLTPEWDILIVDKIGVLHRRRRAEHPGALLVGRAGTVRPPYGGFRAGLAGLPRDGGGGSGSGRKRARRRLAQGRGRGRGREVA